MLSLSLFPRLLKTTSVCSFALLLTSIQANAQISTDPQTFAAELIAQSQRLPSDLNTRFDFVSRHFLGKPYLTGGTLGEGETGVFDQDPLYRFDGFDCTTFVETTVSLAEAKSFTDFFYRLLNMRYDQGQISFITRNHFVELDWNPHNIEAGFFIDRSSEIGSDSDREIATQAFSKKQWFAHLPASEIKISNATPALLESKLEVLHHEGDAFPDVTSRLLYLKKASLLKLQTSLPTPAVLNIVRQVASQEGSSSVTEVTHQVILLRVKGQLRIRAASSEATIMKVVDLSFKNYVRTLMQSPSTLGVNVLQIL